MNFQTKITKEAGYDAWISVILTGLSIHLLIWIIYKILGTFEDKDIIYIHRFCFGKLIGGILNILFIVYFFSLSLLVFRVYIELVQVWMFPLMKTWQIGIIFLILFYYVISGGFRVITGICFWGTIIPFLIFLPLSSLSLEYANQYHLFPILNHSFVEIIESSKSMVFQFLGFESLLMFYPFLKNPAKSQKWAHFGIFIVMLLYIYIFILTILYFNEEHLKHIIWPSVSIMKIVELPIIERFEYIVVSFWFLLILPNISIKLWSACRGVRKMVNIKQRTTLVVLLFFMFFLANFIEDKRHIEHLASIYSKVGFYLLYYYLPFLLIAIKIKKKLTEK